MRKPGSRMIWTWNPEFDHDPIDKLFRGETRPPRSLVKEISWKDNPYFKDSPLMEEMQFDYATDPGKAAHVWGGEYISAIEGAYYVKQLEQAKTEGRIGNIAKDATIRVRTFWDLGRNDATAIWVAQFVGKEIRFLDYIEGKGQEMGYYIQQLHARGWTGCICVLPHDGANETVTSVYGSAQAILRNAGFETQVVPNQGKGAAFARVEAARRLFPQMWFQQDECRPGLKALAAYHERVDEKRNVGLGPMHDWASDPADAFGLCAIAYEEPNKPKKPYQARVTSWMG
jgi:phage terminase large subunit